MIVHIEIDDIGGIEAGSDKETTEQYHLQVVNAQIIEVPCLDSLQGMP